MEPSTGKGWLPYRRRPTTSVASPPLGPLIWSSAPKQRLEPGDPSSAEISKKLRGKFRATPSLYLSDFKLVTTAIN